MVVQPIKVLLKQISDEVPNLEECPGMDKVQKTATRVPVVFQLGKDVNFLFLKEQEKCSQLKTQIPQEKPKKYPKDPKKSQEKPK